jgi:hypothetical protein
MAGKELDKVYAAGVAIGSSGYRGVAAARDEAEGGRLQADQFSVGFSAWSTT